MLFIQIKKKPATTKIAKQKLVISESKSNKFLSISKVALLLVVLGLSFYALFYYRYNSDFNLIVNDVCSPFEKYKLETITELQIALNKAQLDYQVEASTRANLENEIKKITMQLKEAQLELDFLHGNNSN